MRDFSFKWNHQHSVVSHTHRELSHYSFQLWNTALPRTLTVFHKYLTALVFSGGESGAAVLKTVKHTAAAVVTGRLTRGQSASERLEEFFSLLISAEVIFTAEEDNMRGQNALHDVRRSFNFRQRKMSAFTLSDDFTTEKMFPHPASSHFKEHNGGWSTFWQVSFHYNSCTRCHWTVTLIAEGSFPPSWEFFHFFQRPAHVLEYLSSENLNFCSEVLTPGCFQSSTDYLWKYWKTSVSSPVRPHVMWLWCMPGEKMFAFQFCEICLFRIAQNITLMRAQTVWQFDEFSMCICLLYWLFQFAHFMFNRNLWSQNFFVALINLLMCLNMSQCVS